MINWVFYPIQFWILRILVILAFFITFGAIIKTIHTVFKQKTKVSVDE